MFQSSDECVSIKCRFPRAVGYRRLERFAIGDTPYWQQNNRYASDRAHLEQQRRYDEALKLYMRTPIGSPEARAALEIVKSLQQT